MNTELLIIIKEQQNDEPWTMNYELFLLPLHPQNQYGAFAR